MSASPPTEFGFLNRLSRIFASPPSTPPAPAALAEKAPLDKRIQQLAVDVVVAPDPRPVSTILAGLDEELAVFNDDFLSRHLRNEIGHMLSRNCPGKRILDIFYEMNFDLLGPYKRGLFRQVVYVEQRDQFQADIEAYIANINKKVADLASQEAALRFRLGQHKDCGKGIHRLNAKIAVMKWPIPMMEGLLAEVKKTPLRSNRQGDSAFVGLTILRSVDENQS